MSQSVNLIIAKNVGYGMPEGTYLPCSGLPGRTAAVYPCSSPGHYRIHSHVKVRGLKCASVDASFVCQARRNPDFSRQNKPGYSSRSRNRNSEGRDGFESFEEDLLSLKNGPLVSLSASGKSQATSAPGPREKEIVELFKKVQARLRERATNKEEKKVETSQGQGRENGTVDSLLKLLKKHSVEQVRRSGGGGRGKDLGSEQVQESSQYIRGRSTKFSDSDGAPKPDFQEANVSFARPRSSFQRRSPVPRVKYQPIPYNDDEVNSVSQSNEVLGNNQNQIELKLDHEHEHDSEAEIDHEPEPDLDPKDELFFSDMGIADLSDDDSHDHEQVDDNDDDNIEHLEEHLVVQHEDLSALKLAELRALAKSRGLKGFSKMKKGDLIELLTGS